MKEAVEKNVIDSMGRNVIVNSLLFDYPALLCYERIWKNWGKKQNFKNYKLFRVARLKLLEGYWCCGLVVLLKL